MSMLEIQSYLKQKILARETILIGFAIVFLLLLAACGPSAAPDPTVPTVETAEDLSPTAEIGENAGESAYPPPVVVEPSAEEAYPVQTSPPPSPTIAPESYPPAGELFEEPRFRLDLPLKAGGTTVSGQAPPDLAIAVVDVTYNGAVLGAGVSDADGRFVIGVKALPDGNRVGITFAELQPGKTLAEMSQEYFPHRGEGFMNIPNVGIFFDSALVEP